LTPLPSSLTPPRLIVAVVFVVVWGLITHGTYAGSGDEPHYLMIAQSLAFDGDIDLANNYAQPDNLIGAGGLQTDGHARPGVDGVLRPVHDIGMPLLFAPYVRVAYPAADVLARLLPEWLMRATRLNASLIFRHLISLAMAVLTGWLGVQLFALFARSVVSPRPFDDAQGRQAMWWALLVTLSPPLLSHSFLFFTEIPSALLVAWLAKVLSSPVNSQCPIPNSHTTRRAPLGELGVGIWEWTGARGAATGAAIGLLLLIHVRNIALATVFGVWTMSRLRRTSAPWSAWACAAMAAAMPLLIRTVVVHRFWGTWLTTPIARPDLSLNGVEAARDVVVRAVSLLGSPQFGLLPFAPIFVLALPGLWLMRGDSTVNPRAVWALMASYLATLLLPYTNPWGVAGGFAPAARMIVPIVPLLALALFTAARTWPKTARVFVVIQIAIDVFVWQFPKMLWSNA
jgi:hypothetical protein